MPDIQELIKKSSEKTQKFRKGLRPDMVAQGDDPFSKNKKNDQPKNQKSDDQYFQFIDIEKINTDPYQPREYFDPEALEELSNSIKGKGVLQPVIIRKENNQFILVAGERRLRAAKMAGLTTLPTVINDGDPAEIALIENIQRENLTPIEEAKAYKRILEEHGYTHEKLSQLIGKGRSTITEILTINKLPEEIRTECKTTHEYSKAILVEIAKQKTPEEMFKIFSYVKDNKLGIRQARKILRPPSTKSIRSPIDIAVDKIDDLTKFLKKLNIKNMEENDKEKLKPGIENLLSTLHHKASIE